MNNELFFAAAENLEHALRASGGTPRAVIFRMRSVPAMDASGLHAFRVAITKLHRDGVKIFLTAVQPQPMNPAWSVGWANKKSAAISMKPSPKRESCWRNPPIRAEPPPKALKRIEVRR